MVDTNDIYLVMLRLLWQVSVVGYAWRLTHTHEKARRSGPLMGKVPDLIGDVTDAQRAITCTISSTLLE
jgi:hypothetical protein